jgi:hypothetical protein
MLRLNFLTEDLCEEETEKFNIKPMYESLSSISSSNSTLDSNNLDNHDKVQVKKDENNSDETLDNFIGIKNHVENSTIDKVRNCQSVTKLFDIFV